MPLKAKKKPQTRGKIQKQTPRKGQTQWVLAGLEKKDQELLLALSHRTLQSSVENERFEMFGIKSLKLIAQHLCS